MRKRSAIGEPAATAAGRPKFPYDSKPIRDLTNDILNNRASRDALSAEQRSTLARFYEETSKTVKTEAQRLFNVDRARYLRGEIDTPPGLLNDWKAAHGYK